MPRPRDSQRSKVYAAEDAAFPRILGLARLDLNEMQRIVDKVCSSKLVQRKYPRAKHAPLVTDGRARRSAAYDHWRNQVKMPTWARTKSALLHELAHALTYQKGEAGHGWRFCECYLYLVRVYMSKGAEETLRAEFKARKVKFKPPRTRRMTDEQRLAASERMKAMHAQRQADSELLTA